jgi:hypothetical protein
LFSPFLWLRILFGYFKRKSIMVDGFDNEMQLLPNQPLEISPLSPFAHKNKKKHDRKAVKSGSKLPPVVPGAPNYFTNTPD